MHNFGPWFAHSCSGAEPLDDILAGRIATNGIRTHDLPLTKRVLYQLSYSGWSLSLQHNICCNCGIHTIAIKGYLALRQELKVAKLERWIGLSVQQFQADHFSCQWCAAEKQSNIMLGTTSLDLAWNLWGAECGISKFCIWQTGETTQ